MSVLCHFSRKSSGVTPKKKKKRSSLVSPAESEALLILYFPVSFQPIDKPVISSCTHPAEEMRPFSSSAPRSTPIVYKGMCHSDCGDAHTASPWWELVWQSRGLSQSYGKYEAVHLRLSRIDCVLTADDSAAHILPPMPTVRVIVCHLCSKVETKGAELGGGG